MKRNVKKFQNLLFRGQCYTCGAEGHKAEDCTVKPLQPKNAGQGRTLPTCQIYMPETQPCCIGILAEDGSYTITRSVEVRPRTQKPHPTAV